MPQRLRLRIVGAIAPSDGIGSVVGMTPDKDEELARLRAENARLAAWAAWGRAQRRVLAMNASCGVPLIRRRRMRESMREVHFDGHLRRPSADHADCLPVGVKRACEPK